MSPTAAKKLELIIERIVIGSRWLQAPLYIGLVVVLGVVVVKNMVLTADGSRTFSRRQSKCRRSTQPNF